ncbi:hypothetical protein RclHR1_15260007 [Rhizophagus clarus]|nr:hypothetical protein RclHR1_15260007 [Rhizophagus clarus]
MGNDKKRKKGQNDKEQNEKSQQNFNSDTVEIQVDTISRLPVNEIEVNQGDENKGSKRLKTDSGFSDDKIQKMEQQLKEYQIVINKLNEEINKLKDDINELKDDNNKLKDANNELKDELKNTNNELEKTRKQENDKKLLEEENNANNINNISSLQKKLEEKEAELKEKEIEFSKLEEKNAELRKEASKYQSALGNATNIRLGDEDSVKFRQDILDLQKTLENYVTNLKPNMDIDYEKVQDLAQKYGCSTPVDKGHKPFIKALLQRKALDDIIELAKDPVNKGEDGKLELDVETKTRELLDLIENFSASRSGTDELAKVASIKVRQQVYGILGNRGFADVIDPNGSHMHDFIIYVSGNLNNTMNQYRKINDSNKKKEVESIAPKLIQDIYKLFFYLLNVQEPRVEFKYCETGSKIDPNVMKGNWDEDDVPQLRVDICSFPMIGRDLDSPNWKIYTHAKVYPYDHIKTS